MSGLEGIAVLSLACNVMQLISFGHEAVSMCRRIYESGSPEPGLDDYAKGLKAVCDDLEKSLGKKPTPAPTVKTPLSEKRLLDFATKCVKHAKDLEEEMKYLSPSQPGTFGALAVAPKVMWRKKRLERLRLNLADAQKLMDTSILERLFFKAEATYKMNKQGFSELSQELKAFIAQHAKSGSVLQDVVQKQSTEIRDHVTTQSSKTQEVIKSHMSLELAHHGASVNEHVSLSAQSVQNALSQRMESREDSVAREQAYQQLLKSLKYPGMNERRNQVTQTHPRTFRWIFSSSMELGGSESEYSKEDGSSADDDETESIDKSSTMSEESSESPDSSDSTGSAWPQPRDNLVDWLKDDNRKRYWISGKPGSGKSTLMKYIETNDKTIEYCNPGTRCISHFLWRPGTFMQQNIKGLLCSLLHQILADEKSIALRILDNQPSLSTKDSYTDWTVHELKTILLDLIRKSACTYLVLLDGLDEVADTPDEGAGRLLHLIDELVATNQVKVCVSSRPEPALKRSLERYPMLKIQDLTNRDIRLLTRDRLAAMEIDLENVKTDKLSDLICGKAEGVFIWVVLVLSSLQRGLDNYDDVNTLYRRVQSLPKDLTKLYKEMWSRMKEDSDLYRRKTVLLFYMAMELKGIFHDCHWGLTDNLVGLVISTDDEMLESFTSRDEIPDTGLLWEKWRCLGMGLLARCAGLLDMTGAEEAFSSHNTHESKFKSWGRTGIRFTHRTAIDFICHSEEGRELFGAHIPRRDDLLIRSIKTNLMFHRIRRRPYFTSTTFPFRPTFPGGTGP
ncbi:hypothetical protein CORC01_13038 [Colletotrichum orchidophilum]|uniref:Nephrocystin 3-like N-terminal domain-containing protein n=1 Tax=Colletotrichum orchidophilum TaxID=1209926 RepID=A0A1G4AR56_9PEZI|nr:uncharacterized protein CORC01_13038 [Colletotrichum orchidophilum]OHE91648.1 hypothetical protein CORC01_13038 [Colletotrichum orchidophilum]